jgi:hypothetical protein
MRDSAATFGLTFSLQQNNLFCLSMPLTAEIPDAEVS